MTEFFKNLNFESLFTSENLLMVLQVIAILVIGFIIVKIISGIAKRMVRRSLSPQMQMLLSKAITYIGVFIIFLYALNSIGVQLTALLGAAGIVGIALGIASQTSLSNIISGVFLISEKPFEIGDVIRVGDKTGIIMSIDLLSIKMRTFDNFFLRIPNTKIIDSELTNITKFPIRRLDYDISVAYKEDLSKVREILLSVARDNPLCLDEPEPIIIFKNFGDSGIELLFGVWFEKSQFITVKNSVFEEIKRQFEKAGIEIPFPHRTIYTGSESKPFPVRVAKNSPTQNGKRKRSSRHHRT